MRALFVPNPHLRLDRTWAAPYVPGELLSAMAVAEAAGAEPALFDVNRLVEHGGLRVGPGVWEEAARRLEEAEPDAVVFDTWTGTLHHTLLLARAARARLPRVPLLLSGCGTSALAEEVLRSFPFVDGVVRGDLEPAVAALVQSGLPPRDRPWREVADLQSLPAPAWHLALLRPGDTIPLETGRGCGEGCTFCALAGFWPAAWRGHAPERIAGQLRELAARYPGSAFDLSQDPVFFDEPARVRRLCELLEGAAVRWSCHARVDRLAFPELEAMARAGCRGVLFGVESGCPEQQRRCGKGVDLGRVKEVFAEAKRLGLDARASFIVGFPEEDLASLRRTFELVLALRGAGASDVSVQPLRAYPGSQVHARSGGQLCFDPVLCTAAPTDAEALALIKGYPQLLSASYRVPSPLGRERLLTAWFALGALGRAAEALCRADRGTFDRLLEDCAALPDTLDEAVAEVGMRLQRAAGGSVDAAAVGDLLEYERALFAVRRERVAPRGVAGAPSLEACRRHPEAFRPRLAVPARVVHLRRGLDRLLEGDLAPREGAAGAEVLVASVPAAGETTFYTQRAFSLQSFELGEAAADALLVCNGLFDLRTIGHVVAARRGRRPDPVVRACAEALHALAEEGVVELEQIALDLPRGEGFSPA